MGPNVTGELAGRVVVERPDGFLLDATFSAPAGETTVVVGPNGAGKSTLLLAIAGLVALDRGRLMLGERLLDDPAAGVWVAAADRRLGVVFQDYRLFPNLDVLDNVAFGVAARGRGRRDARERARPWLERMGLAALADRRPEDVSGGEAQRVAIARALAVEPDALLLDEPLAALDIETRAASRALLQARLGETGGPRLLVSHDPQEAFLLGDRVLVLESGRVTQAGTAAEVRRHPATPYIAHFAGTNLLAGTIGPDGTVVLTQDGHRLVTAETGANGPVLVTVRPNAVALHRAEPHGSPRNVWPTRVETLEPLGSVTRVGLAVPAGLTVDVTTAAAEALRLVRGSEVWASVKATELLVAPA